MTPAVQLFIMLWANALALVLIFLTLLLGWDDPPWPSPAFWVIQGGIVALNLLAGYPEFFSFHRFTATIRDQSWKPGPRLDRWKRKNKSDLGKVRFRELFTKRGIMAFASYRGVTWISALMSFLAMWILVRDTGGGFESPYASLLVGPAILGPIVVMQARVLIPLGVLAAVVVVATDATSSKTTEIAQPRWLVYPFVDLFLVLWVIFITTIILTDPRLPTPRTDVARKEGDTEEEDSLGQRGSNPSSTHSIATPFVWISAQLQKAKSLSRGVRTERRHLLHPDATRTKQAE